MEKLTLDVEWIQRHLDYAIRAAGCMTDVVTPLYQVRHYLDGAVAMAATDAEIEAECEAIRADVYERMGE